MLKKWDLILLISVVFVALGLWGAMRFFGTQGATVTVKENNEVVYRGALTEDYTLHLSGNTVVVKDRKVFVEKADCREQVCVNHRPISKKGETILCLPHKVSITVE